MLWFLKSRAVSRLWKVWAPRSHPAKAAGHQPQSPALLPNDLTYDNHGGLFQLSQLSLSTAWWWVHEAGGLFSSSQTQRRPTWAVGSMLLILIISCQTLQQRDVIYLSNVGVHRQTFKESRSIFQRAWCLWLKILGKDKRSLSYFYIRSFFKSMSLFPCELLKR